MPSHTAADRRRTELNSTFRVVDGRTEIRLTGARNIGKTIGKQDLLNVSVRQREIIETVFNLPEDNPLFQQLNPSLRADIIKSRTVDSPDFKGFEGFPGSGEKLPDRILEAPGTAINPRTPPRPRSGEFESIDLFQADFNAINKFQSIDELRGSGFLFQNTTIGEGAKTRAEFRVAEKGAEERRALRGRRGAGSTILTGTAAQNQPIVPGVRRAIRQPSRASKKDARRAARRAATSRQPDTVLTRGTGLSTDDPRFTTTLTGG